MDLVLSNAPNAKKTCSSRFPSSPTMSSTLAPKWFVIHNRLFDAYQYRCFQFSFAFVFQEFTIEVEIANNKHSACEVVQLPQGTVKFETLLHEKANGQLITAAVASFAGSFRGREAPARPGFIRLTIDGQPAGQVEYSASQVVSSGNGTPTLRAGDSLEFDVYVDRRTAKSAKPRMRAHRVRVLAFAAPVAGADSSSPVVREPGIVVAVKQGFGFVRCVDREGKDVYFSQSEVAASAELTEGAEVELEIEQDRKGQLVATRISQLPKGTIQVCLLSNHLY
jgi:cold shock CspA family protein